VALVRRSGGERGRMSLFRRRVAGVVAAGLAAASVVAVNAGPATANSGFVQGTLASARNANGRLEAFGTDGNDQVWHRWQNTAKRGLTDETTWTSWQPFTDGHPMRSVAAETNANGKMEAFGLDDQQQVWHRWQESGGWSTWQRLGPLDGRLTSLAVARNQDGRLEVFGTNAQDQVYHSWQTQAATASKATADPGRIAWSGWALFTDGSMRSVAAETNANGTVELFAVNGAGEIYHRRQNQPNVKTLDNTGWGLWHRLGPDVNARLTSLAAARNKDGDGRLEVFGTNAQNQVWHSWQLEAGTISDDAVHGWSTWSPFDGHMRSVAAETNANGSIELFGAKATGVVGHRWQKLKGGGWTGWNDFPEPLPQRAPADLSMTLTSVGGGTEVANLKVLAFQDVAMSAGESRRVEAHATVVMTEAGTQAGSSSRKSIDFSAQVQCVDPATGMSPSPGTTPTSYAETSSVRQPDGTLPGPPDMLAPSLLFTAPSAGVYRCQLVVYTDPGDKLTTWGTNNWLGVSNAAAPGSHWWMNPPCNSGGTAQTCTYIGGSGSKPREFDVFRDDALVLGAQPYTWTADGTAASVYARANVQVTTCYSGSLSCEDGQMNGGDSDHTTVDSYLEVTQLDAQGQPCNTTRSPQRRDVVGKEPHHYNIAYDLPNIPRLDSCGSDNFRMLVHLKWVDGNILKIDGSTTPPEFPDPTAPPYELVSVTHGYMYNG